MTATVLEHVNSSPRQETPQYARLTTALPFSRVIRAEGSKEPITKTSRISQHLIFDSLGNRISRPVIKTPTGRGGGTEHARGAFTFVDSF